MDRVQLFLIFAGLGALIGALITPLVYWVKGRKPASGFFAGVFVGALGNLLCLIPFWLLVKPRLNTASYLDVAVAYNLGVAAVLGNRREEARYYFVQATQVDPQNVSAWLYLANLSTTPLEAWSFIQQARAIAPGNPGVLEATAIVWPQVRHLYGESGPGRSQTVALEQTGHAAAVVQPIAPASTASNVTRVPVEDEVEESTGAL